MLHKFQPHLVFCLFHTFSRFLHLDIYGFYFTLFKNAFTYVRMFSGHWTQPKYDPLNMPDDWKRIVTLLNNHAPMLSSRRNIPKLSSYPHPYSLITTTTTTTTSITTPITTGGYSLDPLWPLYVPLLLLNLLSDFTSKFLPSIGFRLILRESMQGSPEPLFFFHTSSSHMNVFNGLHVLGMWCCGGLG